MLSVVGGDLKEPGGVINPLDSFRGQGEHVEGHSHLLRPLDIAAVQPLHEVDDFPLTKRPEPRWMLASGIQEELFKHSPGICIPREALALARTHSSFPSCLSFSLSA